MKQRLLIARALVNRPRILFLDEPTKGFNPSSARDLRGLIAGPRDEGTTAVRTTLDMEEADAVRDRVAFLSQGKIVVLDTPWEPKRRHGERTAVVLLRSRQEETLRLDDPGDAALVAARMVSDHVPVAHSHEGTLEAVFVEVAGRPL